jgi:hypothetical protein
MAFKATRPTAPVGPTCADCAGPVTSADLPGPRWQAEAWLRPDATTAPNGSPLRCRPCRHADMRTRFGR